MMQVAIIGAGLSGLSCAITLEKKGIRPAILERRRCPGDRFVNAEAMFSILNRPVKDCILYLKENYGITLNPIDTVLRLVMHSASKTGSIDGEIGYTNVRGRREDSFEYQLAKQVKSEITFCSAQQLDAVTKNYEYVVLATGDGEDAFRLGNYRSDLSCSLKGTTVEGNFITNTPHVWFNYKIMPMGYAWLIPFSKTEANLVISYPDSSAAREMDIERQWDIFYDLARRDMKQDFRITDEFKITNYRMGICRQPKIGKTYFVGNCFGALSPGLGFGQFTSILTGIYAAQDICGDGNYEELVKPLFENYTHSLKLRRSLEKLTDDDLDRMVGSLNMKLLSSVITELFSSDSEFDLLKWITPMPG